jgi:hypothetical protein
MVAATALKLCCHGHLQWHDLYTEFHKNVPVGSEVGGGGQALTHKHTHTHRQDGDHISVHFSFRKESRLIMSLNVEFMMIRNDIKNQTQLTIHFRQISNTFIFMLALFGEH